MSALVITVGETQVCSCAAPLVHWESCCCTSVVEMSGSGFRSTGGPLTETSELKRNYLVYNIYWLFDDETKFDLAAQNATCFNSTN